MSERTVADHETVAEVEGLTRRFGRTTLALDNVSLRVPKGSVFGLVGENGAGKTTLIKHLLGQYKPQSGTVRVFGESPIEAPEKVLAGIGYLSEDHDLPGWMRIDELINYTQAFYPDWDDTYAEHLLKTFELQPEAKIKTLSRGQRAQAGLLTALAHRPPLLLLDEPSAGLDAVVRRDILGAVIRTVADEGRTVLFSSHLLDEVERVADYIAMISKGKLVLCDSLDAIKAKHHSLTLHVEQPWTKPPTVPGALAVTGGGRDWTVVTDGRIEEARTAIRTLGATILEETTPSLEDIFVARSGRRSILEEG
ncbi:MAG: ABC transporter ATP-binding protein [Candidatus Hydrogenedentes bacterium]|nr:ABC transporter ATP-binding protein [Candidatus Hydrogenedentota bacterium]